MGAVDDSYGAWYIGQQVSLVLFGVSILQTWAFFNERAHDPFAIKAVVRAPAYLLLTQHSLP